MFSEVMEARRDSRGWLAGQWRCFGFEMTIQPFWLEMKWSLWPQLPLSFAAIRTTTAH